MDSSDIATPGGWLNLLNTRIGRAIVVGALAVSGGGGVGLIYGMFQGAQADMFIEAKLPTTSVNTVVVSKINPLANDESGAIGFDNTSFLFLHQAPSPQTRVSVCTATGAAQPCTKTSGSSNVMSGVYLNGTNRMLTVAGTGGVLTQGGTPAILAPRNYPNNARKYLNVTFTTGTGQTTTGISPAFARMKITPCNLSGVGC
jgi:hypothetical protein